MAKRGGKIYDNILHRAQTSEPSNAYENGSFRADQIAAHGMDDNISNK